ncbi:MAG: DMT family transporter [Bdellovibrionota bacterium]
MQGIFYILLSGLFFAVVKTTIKFLPNMSVWQLICFRSLVSFVLAYAWVKHKGGNIFGNDRKTLLLRGVFGFLGLSAYFYTILKLPLAIAVTLQYLSPIFTTLFSRLFLGERFARTLPFCWLVSIAGVVLLQWKGEGLAGGIVWDPLIALGLLGAMFSGMAYTMVRKLRSTDSSTVIVMYFPMVALPLSLPGTIIEWVTPSSFEWMLLLIIGLFTHLAQLSLTRAFSLGTSAKISVFFYFGSVYAYLIGTFFLKEVISTQALFGLALILTGIILGLVFQNKFERRQVFRN